MITWDLASFHSTHLWLAVLGRWERQTCVDETEVWDVVVVVVNI